MRTIRVPLLLLGIIGCCFAATLPSDVENTLDKLLTDLTSYDTFKMEFQISAQFAGVNANADGTVLYTKAGKFRIEFAKLLYIIGDGQNLWVYTPLSKTFSKGEFSLPAIAQLLSPSTPSPSLGSALSFLLKQILQSQDFALKTAFLYEETLDNKKAVTLTFVSEKGLQIKIWADAKKQELLQIGAMLRSGEMPKLMVFFKVKKFIPNIVPPANAFYFTPPPGVVEGKTNH